MFPNSFFLWKYQYQKFSDIRKHPKLGCAWTGSTHMFHLEDKLQRITCSKIITICKYLSIAKCVAPNEGWKRPPVLSKGLEWYAREFTMDVIEDLIDIHQFGFVKGSSSSVLAIVELVHCWLYGCSRTQWELSCWISRKCLIGWMTKSSHLSWQMQDTKLPD